MSHKNERNSSELAVLIELFLELESVHPGHIYVCNNHEGLETVINQHLISVDAIIGKYNFIFDLSFFERILKKIPFSRIILDNQDWPCFHVGFFKVLLLLK